MRSLPRDHARPAVRSRQLRQLASPNASTALDLTDVAEVALSLLRGADNWRIRAVETLTVGSARLCQRHRSLQVAPLGQALQPWGGGAERARVLLPVEKLTKRPLLGFNVQVDGAPAFLVQRGVTADLEAGHVADVADDAGVQTSERVFLFVSALCEFTPATWKRYGGDSRFGSDYALFRYVTEGVGFVEPLDRRDSWWRALVAAAERVGKCLSEVLGEGFSRLSSADTPLLAAPLYMGKVGSQDAAELTTALNELAAYVEELTAKCPNEEAQTALRLIAEYGKRWQSFVYAEVPLDRPFMVITDHEVPLRLGIWRGWARQPVALNDAHSNHVALGTVDENVEISSVQLRSVGERRLDSALMTGVRRSRERFSFYTSEPARDDRGALRFRLRVPRSIRSTSTLIVALTWAAVGLTAYLLTGQIQVDDLAVLVVPTTFAASLLLTRERNSLARRLQWLSRTATILGTVALWTLAGYAWVWGGLNR